MNKLNYRLYYACVYIMTNKHNSVIYTGLTNDLYRRVREHKEGSISGFSSKYNTNKLIYYEGFSV